MEGCGEEVLGCRAWDKNRADLVVSRQPPRQQGISPTPSRPTPSHPTPPHILRQEWLVGKDWQPDLLWFLILRLGKHQAPLDDISWGNWGAGKTLDEPDKALSEG